MIASATNPPLFLILCYFYSRTKKYTFSFPSSTVIQGESVTISSSSADVTSVRSMQWEKIDDGITTLETVDGKYTIGRVQLRDAETYDCGWSLPAG